MNVIELLATLKAKDIQLAVADNQLRVNGNKQALNDPALLALLREHKPALIELIKAGSTRPASMARSRCQPMASPRTPRASPRRC